MPARRAPARASAAINAAAFAFISLALLLSALPAAGVGGSTTFQHVASGARAALPAQPPSQPPPCPPSQLPPSPSSGDALYDLMAQLVTPYGYPLQQHFVTTSDGFVLRLFRIAGSPVVRARQRAGAAAPTRRLRHDQHASATAQRIHKGVEEGGRAAPQVVFLQHGLLDSSAAWVLNPPGQGLAFSLADAGAKLS